MGNLGGQCVDNGVPKDEQPMTTFRKAMKMYKQPVMLKNEHKFGEADRQALLRELDRLNYVLLDYVGGAAGLTAGDVQLQDPAAGVREGAQVRPEPGDQR